MERSHKRLSLFGGLATGLFLCSGLLSQAPASRDVERTDGAAATASHVAPPLGLLAGTAELSSARRSLWRTDVPHAPGHADLRATFSDMHLGVSTAPVRRISAERNAGYDATAPPPPRATI